MPDGDCEISPGRVVIVGAGQGGVQLASTLRRLRFAGEVVLISAEDSLPYQRPPLSKAYLNDGDESLIAFHSPDYYRENAIELIGGDGVTKIDRDSSEVVLESGTRLEYDRLVCATGSRPRQLASFRGAVNALSLHSRADADRLRAMLTPESHVVLVGGGFVGLEVATHAAAVGCEVTVVEPMSRPLAHVIPEIVSDFLAARHRASGVRLALGASITSVETSTSGAITAVALSDGSTVYPDIVVVGVGSDPNDELAAEAGLHVDNGIIVDEDFTTSDPAISAIGDCCRFAVNGVRRRLTSVQHASDSAIHLAKLLTGRRSAYTAVPWFWSDQANVKLQMAGLPDATWDRAEVIGDADSPNLVVRNYLADALVGGITINSPTEHITMRRELAAQSAHRALPTGPAISH